MPLTCLKTKSARFCLLLQGREADAEAVAEAVNLGLVSQVLWIAGVLVKLADGRDRETFCDVCVLPMLVPFVHSSAELVSEAMSKH